MTMASREPFDLIWLSCQPRTTTAWNTIDSGYRHAHTNSTVSSSRSAIMSQRTLPLEVWIRKARWPIGNCREESDEGFGVLTAG